MRALALILAASSCALAQDPLDIVRRSVERDWTDFEAQKNYTYERQVDVYRYDRRGQRTRSGSETHEILILGGRPYQKLTAKDGQALSERDARKESERLEKESAKRQNESPRERSRYEKEREEDRRYIKEIPEAFVFHLRGDETVSGQPAWVIDADPKPGYKPKLPDAKVFTKVRGKIWIEKATYHWVKMDTEVLEPISFGLGLLRIAPGGSFHFEQARVNDEIWLPSHALVKADARIALLKKLRAEIDIAFREYRKFQSDSKIVDVTEQ